MEEDKKKEKERKKAFNTIDRTCNEIDNAFPNPNNEHNAKFKDETSKKKAERK